MREVLATSTCAAPAVSHAASCTNLVQESIVALHRLVPHSVLPPSVRDPSHVYARSPATSTHTAAASTHAAFLAPTCAIVFPPQSGFFLQLSDCTWRRPSGTVGTKHFLGPPLPLGLYRRYLWVSRQQTLSWASLPLGLYFSAEMHQRPPPLIPRQPLPLELPFGLLISGQIH